MGNKIRIIYIFLMLSVSAVSQDTTKVWHLYVSPGVSYCKGWGTVLEVGMYNPDFWVATTTETFQTSPTVMMEGVRGYYNPWTIGEFQFYFNAATKLVLDGSNRIIIEPGIALVYQPYKHFALQIGGSTPYYDNKLHWSIGFSLNFDF